MIETPVLIAGGGPVGLVLAHELEYRGVDAHLVERNPSTTRHPKMDVTNGRSMEHFRRLGIADEIRSHAVPSDHPMTVVWCTRFGEWELARFEYPSIDWGRDIIRTVNDGSLPLEPDMRISQVVLEPVLKDILERRAKYVGIRFGWALESFEQDADGVTSVIRNGDTGEVQTVRSRYLVGCDGAASVTRKQLGIELDDLMGEDDPTAGRMFMIHFRSQDRGFFERFGTAWHVQAPLDGTVISQNDLDTWTMHVPLAPEVDADAIDPAAFLRARLGADVPCEILVANAWKPRLVVAEKYGNGRVWLAGGLRSSSHPNRRLRDEHRRGETPSTSAGSSMLSLRVGEGRSYCPPTESNAGTSAFAIEPRRLGTRRSAARSRARGLLKFTKIRREASKLATNSEHSSARSLPWRTRPSASRLVTATTTLQSSATNPATRPPTKSTNRSRRLGPASVRRASTLTTAARSSTRSVEVSPCCALRTPT